MRSLTLDGVSTDVLVSLNTPLSRRTVGLGPDTTVHDGIPGYLRGVLQDWVTEGYPDNRYGEWTQLRNDSAGLPRRC